MKAVIQPIEADDVDVTEHERLLDQRGRSCPVSFGRHQMGGRFVDLFVLVLSTSLCHPLFDLILGPVVVCAA